MKKTIHTIIAYLFLFTGVATVTYWILVASGVFGPTLDGWLQKFPYVSPIADIWMGGTSLLFFLYWYKDCQTCILWGIAASSAMIFVSLTALTFRICHPFQYFGLPELIEIVVPAYLFIFGVVSFETLFRKASQGVAQ